MGALVGFNRTGKSTIWRMLYERSPCPCLSPLSWILGGPWGVLPGFGSAAPWSGIDAMPLMSPEHGRNQMKEQFVLMLTLLEIML